MPRGAMISQAADDKSFAAFVLPKSELGQVVQRLWDTEENKRKSKR
jgi:hypothetical protein